MKTKNLFKVLAVLSPLVLSSTFSVNALAEITDANLSGPVIQEASKLQAKEEVAEFADSILSVDGRAPTAQVDTTNDHQLSEVAEAVNEGEVLFPEDTRTAEEIADDIITRLEGLDGLSSAQPILEIADTPIDNSSTFINSEEVQRDLAISIKKSGDEASASLREDVIRDIDENIKKSLDETKRSLVIADDATEVVADDSTEVVADDSTEVVADLSEQVTQVENDSEELNEQLQANAENLQPEEVEAALETIEISEEEVANLEGEVEASDEADKPTLEQQLEKAKVELAEAKEALKEKESSIEALAEENLSLNKAYCSLNTKQNSLETEMAAIRESLTKPVNNDSMQAMMQLFMMNMMGTQGPSYIESLGDRSKRANPFGSEMGMRMLSLSDLFDAKSTGNGINYNVWNVGGNYIGGNSTQAFAPNFQSEVGNERQANPYSAMRQASVSEGFNFSTGINDQQRMNFGMDSQSSLASRNRVENNIPLMRAGETILPNPAAVSGPAPAAVQNPNADLQSTVK